MPAALSQFALVCDAAASTTKKLAKQQLFADYFRSLDEADLPLAVRFASGRVFSASDERVLGVSGAIASRAILALLPIEPAAYRERVIAHGEIGEALATLWPAGREPDAPPLTLRDLSHAFDELAASSSGETKQSLVADLLGRCRAPREAAYVAKLLLGDLRTGAKEGLVQAAVAQAFEKPLDAVRRAQLLVGDLDEVALLAKHDTLEGATLRLFSPVQFMLATPVESAADAIGRLPGGGDHLLCEDKLDGIRAQVHKRGRDVAIYTRTMDRADASFPDVVAALQALPADVILDGEIVPMRDGVVQPFASIQKRLGRRAPPAAMLRSHPAVFIAFDVLWRDGVSLLTLPLVERRAVLGQLAAASAGTLRLGTSLAVKSADEIDAAFAAARSRRNEGLVLKDPASEYVPGRRGGAWLKLKTHLPTLDCVVVAAEYGHGKRRGTLSDYTFAVWRGDPDAAGELVTIGKAYSGVTDAEIAELTTLFKSIATRDDGRVFVVEPRVVMEIAFDTIQPSDRHSSGYALRFPRIKRIRTDKLPRDADRLERVVEIYRGESNLGRRDDPAPPEPTLFDHL